MLTTNKSKNNNSNITSINDIKNNDNNFIVNSSSSSSDSEAEIEYDNVPGILSEDFSKNINYQYLFKAFVSSNLKKQGKLRIENIIFNSMTLRIIMLIVCITIGLQATQEEFIKILINFSDYTKTEYCTYKFSTLVNLAYLYDNNDIENYNRNENTNKANENDTITNPYISSVLRTMDYCFRNLLLISELKEDLLNSDLEVEEIINNLSEYPTIHNLINSNLLNLNSTSSEESNNEAEAGNSKDFFNKTIYFNETEKDHYFLSINLTTFSNYNYLQNKYQDRFPKDSFFSTYDYFIHTENFKINYIYTYNFHYTDDLNYFEYLTSIKYISILTSITNIIRSVFVTMILVSISFLTNGDLVTYIVTPLTNIIKKFRYFLHKDTFDYYEQLINGDNDDEEHIALNKKFGMFSYYFDITLGKRALSLIHQSCELGKDGFSLNISSVKGVSFKGTALILDFKIKKNCFLSYKKNNNDKRIKNNKNSKNVDKESNNETINNYKKKIDFENSSAMNDMNNSANNEEDYSSFRSLNKTDLEELNENENISLAINEINKFYTIFHSLSYGFLGEIINENTVVWKHKEDEFEDKFKKYSRELSKIDYTIK